MTRFPSLTALTAGAALALAGCTSFDILSGDKIDYHGAAGAKTAGLEVPPDLTQLTKDSRYQTQGGAVSAAAFNANTAGTSAAPAAVQSVTVAPQNVGDLRIERAGNERWLHSPQSPEQLWPLLQAFWKERGFTLTQDLPAAGVMETDWAENRGKLPLDFIRATVGKVFDGAYSTGELDRFRTRLERDSTGTQIYITHRGMIEVYTGQSKESTSWQPRQADPQLEGELLSRLMLRLGASEEAAKTALVPGTPSKPGEAVPLPPVAARARLLADRPGAALQVDDGFDRAWRRVGVALDRSGFTVEDRDRSQGLYFVRYIDPKFAGREEPNLFSKMFGWIGKKKDDDGSPARYRVLVKGESDSSSVVSVLDGKGAPENGETGKRITALLLDDLK